MKGWYSHFIGRRFAIVTFVVIGLIANGCNHSDPELAKAKAELAEAKAKIAEVKAEAAEAGAEAAKAKTEADAATARATNLEAALSEFFVAPFGRHAASASTRSNRERIFRVTGRAT